MQLKLSLVAGLLALSTSTASPIQNHNVVDLDNMSNNITLADLDTTLHTESTRSLTATITLGCHGHCPAVQVKVDPEYRPEPHTCVRDALTALANWRFYCDGWDRWHLKSAPFKGGDKGANWQHLYLCREEPPSISLCCAVSADLADPNYTDYPKLMRSRQKWGQHENGTTFFEWYSWVETHSYGRKTWAIKSGWDQFNDNNICTQWRTEDEDQYAYFMANLKGLGLEDADTTGQVFDTCADQTMPGNPRDPACEGGIRYMAEGPGLLKNRPGDWPP
ncbi:hypothetical protein LTR20_009037 [Exophiala xenobiotica]|nr:hypothetical protein LTR41_005389 [Exophiala xenobiotica]KAK5257681.1 hypothetical protein LTR40_009409 [Exophiala xenobiotica]KAK5325075.1 hypothetical protein LTR93_004552 [Exophiala xenobiotica]KAK5367860.1 hypothetical protein LTS13_007790 [Exophiala xenobiotica]KAK5397656.1 hypothetical protein LTR79_005171 [Exophiala xenobiotica]